MSPRWRSRAPGCWVQGQCWRCDEPLSPLGTWCRENSVPAADAPSAGPGGRLWALCHRHFPLLRREVQGSHLRAPGAGLSTPGGPAHSSSEKCRCHCCPHLPEQGEASQPAWPAARGGEGPTQVVRRLLPQHSCCQRRRRVRREQLICFCLSVLAFLSSHHMFMWHGFLREPVPARSQLGVTACTLFLLGEADGTWVQRWRLRNPGLGTRSFLGGV